MPPHIVSFVSQDPKIATVDENGTIKAVKKGSTEIIVYCNDKETDKFILTVTER